MSTLHVRNVPEDLYEEIQRRAAAQRRSISSEVISLLRQAVSQSQASQAELLAEIRRRRLYRPADHGAPDTLTLLREDRER